MTRAARARSPRRVAGLAAGARCGALALAALAPACGAPAPPPQALVVVDTDARVPALFDRVRIAVLGADGALLCATGCEHERVLDARTPWPVSFGIANPSRAGAVVYVRATLLAGGRAATGAVRAATTIERVAQVRFASAGVVVQELFLPLACTGSPADARAGTSCDARGTPGAGVSLMPLRDRDAASRVGSWPPSLRRGCAADAGAGDPALHDEQVCVEGGVFWLGSERARTADITDAVPERPVAVSGFYLDRYEYTVGRYRAALRAGFASDLAPLAWRAEFVQEWNRDAPCEATPAVCASFRTADDPAYDALPLNGVPFELAASLCAREGRRLPTEVEWEWAAGGRHEEYPHPWGSDAPGCGDLAGVWSSPPPRDPARRCPDRNPDAFSPGPVGSHPFDRTPPGLYDLGGSVSEWVRDPLLPYDDPCWVRALGAVDPRCARSAETPPDAPLAARGASWVTPRAPGLYAAGRLAWRAGHRLVAMGFRCASDGR